MSSSVCFASLLIDCDGISSVIDGCFVFVISFCPVVIAFATLIWFGNKIKVDVYKDACGHPIPPALTVS